MSHEIYERAIKKFGASAQIDQCIEELAELILALRHHSRNKTSDMNVCYEIADVEIMLEQMKLIFGQKLAESCRLNKLSRLEFRLGGEG